MSPLREKSAGIASEPGTGCRLQAAEDDGLAPASEHERSEGDSVLQAPLEAHDALPNRPAVARWYVGGTCPSIAGPPQPEVWLPSASKVPSRFGATGPAIVPAAQSYSSVPPAEVRLRPTCLPPQSPINGTPAGGSAAQAPSKRGHRTGPRFTVVQRPNGLSEPSAEDSSEP